MAERKIPSYRAKQLAGLVPTRYSETYQRWKAASTQGSKSYNPANAAELSRQHARQFGVSVKAA